jgi:hypothetical protein
MKCLLKPIFPISKSFYFFEKRPTRGRSRPGLWPGGKAHSVFVGTLLYTEPMKAQPARRLNRESLGGIMYILRKENMLAKEKSKLHKQFIANPSLQSNRLLFKEGSYIPIILLSTLFIITLTIYIHSMIYGILHIFILGLLTNIFGIIISLYFSFIIKSERLFYKLFLLVNIIVIIYPIMIFRSSTIVDSFGTTHCYWDICIRISNGNSIRIE